MTIEEQVTSLELSKKLKELRVPQECLFTWVKVKGEWYVMLTSFLMTIQGIKESYSAFTVAELGEMFKSLYIMSGYISRLKNFACRQLYAGMVLKQCIAETEVDARAKMLIYLAENGLIELQAKHS